MLSHLAGLDMAFLIPMCDRVTPLPTASSSHSEPLWELVIPGVSLCSSYSWERGSDMESKREGPILSRIFSLMEVTHLFFSSSSIMNLKSIYIKYNEKMKVYGRNYTY